MGEFQTPIDFSGVNREVFFNAKEQCELQEKTRQVHVWQWNGRIQCMVNICYKTSLSYQWIREFEGGNKDDIVHRWKDIMTMDIFRS